MLISVSSFPDTSDDRNIKMLNIALLVLSLDIYLKPADPQSAFLGPGYRLLMSYICVFICTAIIKPDVADITLTKDSLFPTWSSI